MNARVGFIGGGNMAEALISGLIETETVLPSKLSVSDTDTSRLKHLSETYGIKTFKSNVEIVANSDIVFLAVKPQVLSSVLNEIKNVITPAQIIISIAAGYPISKIEEIIGDDKKIVRAMPNILVKVRKGSIALCQNFRLLEDEIELVKYLFESVGSVFEVDENLMDAITGLSGSGPAFIFMVIEALADGGVKAGISRKLSLKLAAETVSGAAQMVLEGRHPEVLKDMVTSPAGTTIEGIAALESKGMRSAFIEAVFKAYKRSKEISELIKKL
jgi:pyrroline-5-carboxylate reductase